MPKTPLGGRFRCMVATSCLLAFVSSYYFESFNQILIFSPAINCTEPPFPVKNNDLGRYNWTGTDGVDPRPYATSIKYFCPRENWGYPSTGESEVTIHCRNDGTWSNAFNIETCMSEFKGSISIPYVFCQSYPVPSNHRQLLRAKALKECTVWK